MLTYNALPGDKYKQGLFLHDAIKKVDTAIKGMQYLTAIYGMNSRDISSLASFGTRLGDNLEDSKSALVDADLSRESARLNSLQTKEQLGIKSLTVANGQSQNLLELFQG